MNEDPCTPKEEKQERLSRHKETIQHSQAEDEAHFRAQQRLVYDRSCRSLKRRSLVRKHEFEQEQFREVTSRSFSADSTQTNNRYFSCYSHSSHRSCMTSAYCHKEARVVNGASCSRS